METQQEPCFRPRVLPMPKVGDEICFALYDGKTTYTGRVTSIVGGRKFKADSTLGELTRSVDHNNWNFADPAVEAQRLQEAAWRADTRPLPEWIQEAMKQRGRYTQSKDIEGVIEHIFDDSCVKCEAYYGEPITDTGKAATLAIEAVPHLLRWQAQQEGGKP